MVNGTTFSFTKSPLLSKTLIGIGVSLLPFLQKRFGLELSDADVQAIVENLCTLGGAALAIYGRFSARSRLAKPPVSGLCVLVALSLIGCAGSRADREFRARVESVEVGGGAYYDVERKMANGEARVSVRFRNPADDAKSVKPPAFRAPAPPLREPGDIPEAWRRTLYHPDDEGRIRVIHPVFTASDIARFVQAGESHDDPPGHGSE